MSALDDLLRSRGLPVGASATTPRAKSQPVEAATGLGGMVGVLHAPKYYYDLVQGTTEWFRVRSGIPTASAMDKIITPGGERSKSAEKYLYHLLAERILGRPLDQDKGSFWTIRGSEMEAEALAYYRFQRDCATQPVGFITTADGRVGASPDQLIGEDGCLEIKCPSPEIHMMYLMQAGGAYTAYKVQCQTQLFVSQRAWADVGSYFPGLPEAIIRIERDERYIAKIAAACEAFCDELDSKWAECKARGWGVASEALKDSRFKHLPALDELLKLAGVP